MTQIITRFFDDAEAAREARYELVNGQGFSHRIIDLYDTPNGLAEALSAQSVHATTARAYEKRMDDSGGAVILVRAGYKPLRVAHTTRTVLAARGAAPMRRYVEEVAVKDPLPAGGSSILSAHPHIFLRDRDPLKTNYHMADYPLPLIIRREPPQASLIPRHGRMASFPVPLISRRNPIDIFAFPRHARMADFPLPLISRRKPFTGSIFRRHARMANFPIPLISRRKPKDRFAIPRHGRMATVPIPLLINGETGKNALIPGGPRMANFPIGLLSKRKPFTGSIFRRHARMANFPLPLISRRKPFTGSIISRHARMADLFLPLVIRRDDTTSHKGNGFSFSKMIGMPTVLRK